MTQSPLFPDIVPEPDETRWDIFDSRGSWIDQVVGKEAALTKAQKWSDEEMACFYVGVGATSEDGFDEIERKFKESECVRPFSLPW